MSLRRGGGLGARGRRGGVAALAAAALLVTGCTQVNEMFGQAQETRQQAEEIRGSMAELSDITRERLESFDWSQLGQYDGVYLGDNSRVVEFMRSMPGGANMDTFEIRGDEGTLVVNYGDKDTTIDPALLQDTLRDIAEQAEQRIQNLERVEFHVGDEVYTF
ncbi:MAG: DUF4825 domain-containing protein [Micrococcus sp.]|nr:DUF4825 domain-containing protein [Micrococcus sp.]